ncbi:MAG: glycosyltransferase family 2 protein [Chitinophagaceae bacterium]|nr:glycosyltransferase family 2 protein [Chitinophagaceae bacterium]
MHITVVIPTYNRPQFLKKAIEKVLLQSYQNFTIFISDNASGLETEQVVTSFKDSRIIFHSHEVNIGMQANWRFCLESAPGDYIAFLEDDNYFNPNHLQEAVNLMEKYKIDFYCCNSKLNNTLYTTEIKDLLVLEKEQVEITQLLLDIKIPASGVVFNKRLVSYIDFNKAKDLWCMDRFFWRSMILNSGLIFNPSTNIIYVVHENNITHTLLYNRRLRAKASAQNRFVDRYIIYKYITSNPLKADEIISNLLKRDPQDLQYVLPCFFSSEKITQLSNIGNKLIKNSFVVNKNIQFKKTPKFVACILIRKINFINELIGGWRSPKLLN